METERLHRCSVQVLQSHCGKPSDSVHLVWFGQAAYVSCAQHRGLLDRDSCQSVTCMGPGSGSGRGLLIRLILQTTSLSCCRRVGGTVPSGQGPHATILLFLIYRTVFDIMYY